MSGKNSHIHIMIDSKEKKKLMDKAEQEGINFSEWCRQKLRDNSQLNRIEKMLTTLLSGKRGDNRKE